MKTILDTIIDHKKKLVRELAEVCPIKRLEQSIYFSSETVSLKKYLLRPDKSGIISEFKRKSPSKGDINQYAKVEKTTIGYMQAGSSSLSVLTDKKFFAGKNQDLEIARKFNYCPILRKDFIIDEYQIFEAKSIGADAILLIASVLSPAQVKTFTHKAHELGLEVLLEIYEEKELDHYFTEIDQVGINNRNLKTFEVDFEHAISLSGRLPQSTVKVAESGINSPEDVKKLKKEGFNGFLIGERFMKYSQPELEAQRFINQLKVDEYA